MSRLAIVAALIFLGGCGSTEDQIRVSVASSLGEVLEVIVDDYQREYPDARVEVNVAGSATLVRQVDEGAPVDLLITADAAALDSLSADSSSPTELGTNELVLLVHRDADPPITTAEDLTDDHLIVGCDRVVPCGRLLDRWRTESGSDVEIDSVESNVRQVRARVVDGEADAGFVYRTDVLDLDATETSWIPVEPSVEAAAVLASIGDPPAEVARLRDFVVESARFGEFGFGEP